MTSVQQLWWGYTRGGERATLDVGNPGSKILLLGSRATEMAVLAALSAKEAGAAPVVFDLAGSVARSLSGHLDTYDFRSFLYDSERGPGGPIRTATPTCWIRCSPRKEHPSQSG